MQILLPLYTIKGRQRLRLLKLKRYATLLIGSSIEDSVVKYIHQDWSNRYALKSDFDIG